jgi:hypothetical protein
MTDLQNFTGMLDGLPAHIKQSLNVSVGPEQLLRLPCEGTVVTFDKPTMEISFRFDKEGKLVDVLGRGKQFAKAEATAPSPFAFDEL